MFSKILIANRGEIAIRIIRACKEMGIATVAIFSEADKDALHVSLSDECYCIGPALVKDSYLNISAILSLAIATKAQAIHPGYGLLSENHKFANLCEQCGIKFIGPSSEIIAIMGDKDKARQAMISAGIPVVPGSDVITSFSMLNKEAKRITFPLLLKARSGGGGRGIRLVNKAAELKNAYYAATQEALAAFGDESVYLEKFLSPVKHIEMQIIADNYGNVVCLGERECSIQRKNQKLIEESPSIALPEAIRQQMITFSTKAAKSIGYSGVGTFEFLLCEDNSFYFIEMNTRLQVEHPVTEMVTGIDLLQWQIRVAAGIPLSFMQSDIESIGHAIECRINAENPRENNRPSSGRITLLHIPGGPWVRFDSAIYQDYYVPPYYDSMIGKLIVRAASREEAIRKMQAALCELVIEGIDHNGELQMDILSSEEFVSGKYTTDFLLRSSFYD